MEKKSYISPRLKALNTKSENDLCLQSADTDTEEGGDFEPEAKESFWEWPLKHSAWDDEL